MLQASLGQAARRRTHLPIALAGAVLASATAAQAQGPFEMRPPPLGARYAFACVDASGRVYQEEYRVTKSSNDEVAVDVLTGSQQNSYEKPVFAMGTTIAKRERIDGQDRSMSSIPSSFADLRKLVPGAAFRSYITERRTGASPISWSYNITVMGREIAYHRDFGDLAVVLVSEDRFANLYASSLQSHIAPALGFPVYWRYRDSNRVEVECRLASASGVGTPVAAAPPAAQAAPVQQVAAAPPAPQPAAPAARPARPASAAPAASRPAAPAGADPSPQARIDQLKDLLRRKLITQDEYDLKEQQILGTAPGGGIAVELESANRLFRDKKITQQEFVQRRAQALAKITPSEMPPRDGLILLNQLLESGLISATEHKAKRELMLSAL
ncbi:MAG: SHOCT domain-containing protein [Alphaproteobacteria bacterium]|nr:SHOCT domain-containing protein [Alphaproteobacteria bacterium]